MPRVFCPQQPGQQTASGANMAYRPGPGSPVGPRFQERRREALYGLAVEMAKRAIDRHWAGWNITLTPADSRIHGDVCMRLSEDLERLGGLCDRFYRTAKHSTTPWAPAFGQAGAPVVRSSFFDEACATYVCPPRPAAEGDYDPEGEGLGDFDFLAFTEEALGKHVEANAYGVAGDIIKLRFEAIRLMQATNRLSHELIEQVVKAGIFGDAPNQRRVDFIHNVIEGINAMMSSMSMTDRNAFQQRLEARLVALRAARSTEELLHTRVRLHVEARAQRRVDDTAGDLPWLDTQSEDVLTHISRYLSVQPAVALLATCSSFSRQQAFRKRLPHLRIRQVLGCFPHQRRICRDRAAIAAGQTGWQARARPRDFVVARHAVRLYVDFVVPSLRPKPLTKLPRKDGLDNTAHDFSDDEFEEPPEKKERRGPQPTLTGYPLQSPLHQKHVRKELRLRKAWEDAEGPEEPYDRYEVLRRVGHHYYFDKPMELEVCLVFADTHEEVQDGMYNNGLIESNALARDGGKFSAPLRYIPHHMPAQAKFHVPHLTAENDNRLFKLRVTGRATLPASRGGWPVVQTLYTPAFEVVSASCVVDAASKRKTADERKAVLKAHPAKRARAPGAVQTD